MATIQKIIPNLWFDRQAEEAVKFYVPIFYAVVMSSYG
jgi:predicted 3-demethylubiquinone-9 3-methyltransferase (glyoxalase superfamily)